MNCLAPAIGLKHEASRTRSKLKTAGFAQFIINPLTVAWAREKTASEGSLNRRTTVWNGRLREAMCHVLAVPRDVCFSFFFP